VRGTLERFPPSMFLRGTSLTEPDAAINDLARDIAGKGGSTLERLHALLGHLHETVTFDADPTHTTTTAAQAYALKRGVCQDLSHIFIAAARRMDIPARYVSGHMHRVDGITELAAGHAWVEAYTDGLGWVGFDPTNGICITDAHVRVAIGLDYLGAAPVRGSRYGGAAETMAVNIRVAQAQEQSQT
jgi:transglutaminase-like putative cysteine protease